ncbi:NADH:flavin oxidoreductase/NADH oxidase [Acinetobacter equi]|uniref:Oxidoreductase n=1 Tax=Acinetobacter equi TaxID=1324350 RepID=A0A0N9VDZ8_9GAMM|nr:NADH:flavin oxidoreductase/NADH oxidase [Acinetobacter equi]ALH95374.1 oxidoreductase [Acinetobacter equi]
MALLFQPIQFGELKLSNKIVIAPMCQYSANEKGEPTFWHEQQWAQYALSGAGLCIVEATAVQPEGRISYADLGLWNNQQAEKIKDILLKVKKISPMPIAVQLAHAGRKASSNLPWKGGRQISANDDLGWQTVSASHLPFHPEDMVPTALDENGISLLIQDFTQAAKRAVNAGFDLIEIHAAHGYLLHQFLSPLSNQRTDEYGGNLENRMRLTLDVFKAIKESVPKKYPIGIRISATDWVENGWDIESSKILAQKLEDLGAAYIHVSTAGLHIDQSIQIKENYQVPFAEEIKKTVKIPVIAVGMISDADQAEEILQNHQADAIGIARAILYNPHWPWHAAAKLGEKIQVSPQYLRSQPHGLKDLFISF